VSAGTRNVVTWSGPGLIGWGLTGEDFFLIGILDGLSQPIGYETTLWSDGYECPTSLAQALSGNNVVVGLGGDPSQVGTTCTLLGIRRPDAGPQYNYLSDTSASISQIADRLATSSESRSFVVTAMFEVDAGFYSYIAESTGQLADGGFEQFDTLIETPTLVELPAAVQSLADAGYIVTASSWRGQAYYTLVGTRLSGSSAAHLAVIANPSFLTYSTEVAQMLSDGYSPVSFMVADLLDGGSNLLLIGEK
jgi:hypothetical protein